MKKPLSRFLLALAALCALPLPSQAQALPSISPSLTKMLGALPIAGLRAEVDGMVDDLRKTSCGGGLTACYMTQKTLNLPKLGQLPVQLYFLGAGSPQQTFLLVLNRTLDMPALLKPNVQKILAGTQLTDAIISISTADLVLDTAHMPQNLRSIVASSYFNVGSLHFDSGVQFTGRGHIGGLMGKLVQNMWHVPLDAFLLRAGVALPIPDDMASSAGSGIGLAQAMADSDSMKKGAQKALMPEAFVEFQLAPGQAIREPLGMAGTNLTDATLFFNNLLVLGYQGNVSFDNVKNKSIVTFFSTPIAPEGAMDLLDFQFGLAMPASFTLEDYANISAAFASPMAPGGGFIKGINQIKKPLLLATKPLSVFQLVNPNPPAPYAFGDRSKPFPTLDKFNILLLGPLSSGGPLLKVSSNARILGLTMGKMDVVVDGAGFNGMVLAEVMLKMGPLGKNGIKLQASANITEKTQLVHLKGNVLGRVLELTLDGTTLTMDSPATCATPFEIKAKATINDSMDVAALLDAQAGVNVDPAKLQNCIGKDLQAALTWVSTTGKDLSGYAAKDANAALKKISDDADAAAKAAQDAYNKTKDQARDAAQKGTSAAMHAFNDAGNAFKGIGKKKKHHSGPDPLFAASVFDWDYFYDQHPTLLNSVPDLATYWHDRGFAAGQQGAPEFNARYYMARYLDVQQKCQGDLQCALQHWLDLGIGQGRQGSKDVSVYSYLQRYSTVRNSVGSGNYEDAMEDWLNNSDRNGTPYSSSDGPVSGPIVAGGGGGGPWSDADLCNGSAVTAVRISSGSSIDAVQFGYANGTWGPRHGSQAAFNGSVDLLSGERIVRVDFSSGSRVDGLRFTTNKGRKIGPFGRQDSNGSYTVTPGEFLGCMAGRSGAATDQLVFSSTGLR